jgi:ATP-dependent DNA helicase PIF1
VSGSFPTVIDQDIQEDPANIPDPVPADLPHPPSQSMVPNLNITTTEADQILQELSSVRPAASAIPAPSIQSTPIDEAAGKERLFAMAFPTLYPTGQADFNCPRVWTVLLPEYAYHLRFRDGRFGSHPRWRFFIFNLIIRRKAGSSARFYVSKSSRLKDLDREQLLEALATDNNLVRQIVRQGGQLTGTRPFWASRSQSLQSQARFLSPTASPVFITLSAADMQWVDLHRHFPGFPAVTTRDDRFRHQFVWDSVQNHPHIIAHYLLLRFKSFVKHVLQPYLQFTDSWYRFEWQARGSGHLHCLFWITTRPPLLQDSPERRAVFAQ